MANLSQHEAAELWELARDHFITAAKLQFLGQHAHDTQLRSLTEQHVRRLEQAGQQIAGLISQDGTSMQANHGFQSYQQNFSQFQSAPSFTGQQGGLGASSTGQTGLSFGNQGGSFQYQTNAQGIDVLIAGEGLKDCKRMAIALVLGATESSQPARNILYQLAGEHLQMAEQHYRWLEQKGIYASPKADYQAISEYSQKVRQISQAGRQASQEHMAFHQQTTFQSGQFGQGQQYGTHSQTYGTQGQFGSQTQHQYGTQGYTAHFGTYQESPQTQSLSSTGTVRSGQQYNQ